MNFLVVLELFSVVEKLLFICTGEALLIQLWAIVKKSNGQDDEAKKAWNIMQKLQIRDLRDANQSSCISRLKDVQSIKMVLSFYFSKYSQFMTKTGYIEIYIYNINV